MTTAPNLKPVRMLTTMSVLANFSARNLKARWPWLLSQNTKSSLDKYYTSTRENCGKEQSRHSPLPSRTAANNTCSPPCDGRLSGVVQVHLSERAKMIHLSAVLRGNVVSCLPLDTKRTESHFAYVRCRMNHCL